MTKNPARIGLLLVGTLALGACRDQVTTPGTLSPLSPANRSLAGQDAAALGGLSASLPAGVRIADHQGNPAARVINPGDYVCSDNTAVIAWLNDKIVNTLTVDGTRLGQAVGILADEMPLYEAIFYQTPATTQYFGYHGEHTKAIGKAERQLKDFWAISSAAGIQVVAMHGSMLIDTDRTSFMYRSPFFTAMPAPVASFYADTLRRTLVNSKTMTDGNYPYFTFNSVAIGGVPGLFADKIIMGDGIMAVYDDLGFGDVAPQAILAHEYGHQVQFNKDYGIVAPAPEATRFQELNADAMAAYFLTHKRGATLNQKRVEEFLRVFFNIGDCAFSNAGHHGTPNQRLAAARLGFQLANEAQKQGQIMSPDEFQAKFLAAYPAIIAPDAN